MFIHTMQPLTSQVTKKPFNKLKAILIIFNNCIIFLLRKFACKQWVLAWTFSISNKK